MKYKQLNIDWNAEPNAPEVKMTVEYSTVTLEFFLNYFVYDNFQKDEKGILTFNRVHKFSLNSMNDEGYFRGQYRYKHSDLPYGEFYEIESDWENDFHKNNLVLLPIIERKLLKHFIFFFKDNTFECVAESYEFRSGYFAK
jgi:hypothetical protein